MASEQPHGEVSEVRRPSAELRLAVAMNGGVSLAVWIGGVTEEILHLVRSSPPRSPDDGRTQAYAHLVDALDYDVVVDVISGASAGGINGGLLALAIARNIETTHSVRKVWIEEGDLAELLRPATSNSAPSLLDGDYFYDRMKAAFRTVGGLGRATDTDPPEVSVRLTASMLSGTTTEYPGTAGTRIIDTDFRSVFEFTTDDLRLVDDRAADHAMTDRLTMAARATASFPFAFEPTWVPLAAPAAKAAKRPDMSAHVKPDPGVGSDGMWVVDGGALNNKPLDEALDQVFRRSANRAVRRALVYVVPDPGDDVNAAAGEPTRPPEAADEMPGLLDVVFRSAVTMPRNQSLRDEIEAVEQNNLIAGSYATLRWDLSRRLGTRLPETAAAFEDAYRTNQARRSARGATKAISEYLAGTGELGRLHQRLSISRVEQALEAARIEHYPRPFLPRPGYRVSTYGEFDRADATVFEIAPEDRPSDQFWGYGLSAARRVASAPIDLGQELLRLIPADPDPDRFGEAGPPGDIGELNGLIEQSHEHLATILAVRTRREWVQAMAKELLTLDERDEAALDKWAARYFRFWNDDTAEDATTGDRGATKRADFTQVGDAVLESARVLVRLHEHVRRWLAWSIANPDALSPKRADALAELGQTMDQLCSVDEIARVQRDEVPDAGGTEVAPETMAVDATTDQVPESVLRQLLAVELIFNSTTADLAVPQRVDLAQISAFAESPVAPDRATPAKKLTGVEVGHFAAFYRKSWRGNDYLWGRLDGAERLTTVAMGGDRLTQRFFGRGADVITAALEPALTEVAGNEPLTAALRAEWARDRLRPDVVAEIDAIDRGTPAASFPALTKRIVRRRQLEILHEELPSIATELRRDEREGVALSPSALAFLDFAEKVFDPAGRVKHGPDVLEEALDLLRVGEEDLIDEADSDRFGRVVGQTAAVTSTTLRNAVPWKGGKVALTWLRGAGLIAHFLTRLTTVRPNQSGLPALVLMALLAAGGAAYASVFVLGKGGLLLSGIGVGLMAVPLLVAARRAGWLAVPLLIAALLLPALVWNADEWLERDNPVNRFILDNPDPSTVIAAIVSFTVVGLLPGRRRRRPPRVRGPRVNPLWRR